MTTIESINSGLLFSCVVDKETHDVIQQVQFKNFNLKYDGILGNINDAITYLKNNRSPKILIVDISKSDLPINDIAKLSEVCEPGISVIVIGTRNDVGVFRELVRLGIRDYLIKPLTLNHLVRSLENIITLNKGHTLQTTFSKFGKVVSFLGARGGIGVTTLAVNSAWLMAERYSRRIGLIDANLQLGTVSQFLDLEATTGLQDILEFPERIDETLIDRFMIKYSPHLLVMCGQGILEKTHVISPEAFDPIIKGMLGNFHYTIFDLPRYFGDGVNLNILGSSNIVVIVTDLSIIGLKDTSSYLEVLKRHRTTDQQIIIVVNKDGEYRSNGIEIKDFEEALDHKINIFIPYEPHRAIQALTKGVPAPTQGASPFVTSLEVLTDKIMGKEIYKTPVKKLFNLFSFKRS